MDTYQEPKDRVQPSRETLALHGGLPFQFHAFVLQTDGVQLEQNALLDSTRVPYRHFSIAWAIYNSRLRHSPVIAQSYLLKRHTG